MIGFENLIKLKCGTGLIMFFKLSICIISQKNVYYDQLM